VYVSLVIVIDERRSISCTTFISTPAANANAAAP
jgi:hypothetical protein